MSSDPRVDRLMQPVFDRGRCAFLEASWDVDERIAELRRRYPLLDQHARFAKSLQPEEDSMTETQALTLTEFLSARIAEDEAAARKCVFPQHGGAWTHDGDGEVDCAGLLVSHPVWVCQAAHIARHDPARVLAECEAKRRIVELTRFDDDPASAVDVWLEELAAPGRIPPPVVGALIDVLRALAAPYADHPDYRQEWKP